MESWADSVERNYFILLYFISFIYLSYKTRLLGVWSCSERFPNAEDR